jgi:subtilisin family serine protease
MKFARNGSLSILALMFLHALVPGFLHAQPQRTVGRPRQQASFQPAPNAPKYAPDRVLVRFRPETPKPRAQAAHAAIAAQVIRSSRLVRGLDVVRLPEKMTVGEALSAYRRDPTVLYAEPDYVVHVEQNPVTPNDPGYPQLWGLHNTGQTGGTPGADIHAPQAWSLSTGSPNVVVGVIDTGIDYNHEDLNVNMFRNPLDCNSNGVDDDGNGFIDDCYGIDTFNGDSDPMDDFFHGTHVAGTIGAAGNNGIGVIGVNWQVKLLACKFIGSNGWGYTSGAITCLDYMATMKERGVNIVATNNSWGGDAFSQALYDAIDVQRQKGILFIAAAGNAASDNDGAPMFPAGYYLPNIIAVAATDDSDSPALFSNFGGHSVHLGAPGVGILSTTPGNTYTIYSGTSMAAPHVTGAAALLAAQDPSRDWKTVRNLILAGGDAIPAMTNTISQKRLNVRGAMTCTNSTVLSRLQPRTTIATAAVGLAVDLAVLHINCGRPNGDFTVSLDGGIETIPLRDDGGGADQEANDGIYSAQWTPSATGSHTLAFPGGDVVTLQVLTPYRYSTTTFTWRTIAGTPLNLDDTERSGDSVLVSPPFPIQFGGGSFDRLYVNSNGNITFTAPFPSAVVEPIPSASTATLVAPFWDDLVLFPYSQSGPPADAYWEVVGAAPNRELVIEWRDVSRVDPSAVVGILPCEGRITFQVVFFEGRSDILFNYADVHFADPCVNVSLGRLASVGVQVTPRVGTQFSYQSPSLSDGFAVLWQMGNSAPAITQLSPFTALTTDTGVSVKVLGSNFVPEATVRWNGADLPTTFVNSSELRADVSTSKLSTPGRVQLSVNNPGGGLSNSLPFDVYSSHPVPTLGSIPELGSIHAGDPGPKTLTASGSQFVTNSVLRWNGNDRPTTTFDSTRLTAEIPASDYAVAGTYEVTVFNPGPGGGTSNALTIQLNNPLPRLYGIWPDFAPVGGPDFTMAVFSAAGGTFNSASIVRWNGSDRPTTFVSRDILEAAIPASDIASVGTAKVTVFNPAPGGATHPLHLRCGRSRRHDRAQRSRAVLRL